MSILNDERTNILAFDPSQNYTGWLLYKPHRILHYGCIRKDRLLKGQEFKYVMDERNAFQMAYTEELMKVFRLLDPVCTHVVLEQPTGSRSVSAAWSLAMSSSIVISTAITSTRKRPMVLKERDAKMHMFQSDSVTKQETSKMMWSYWRAQGIQNPEDFWANESVAQRRECMEAVADAMLILNLYLSELYNGLDIQNK